MKTSILVLLIALTLTPTPSMADVVDAGTVDVEAVDAGLPVAEVVDAGVALPPLISPNDTVSLDDPRAFVVIAYKHIKAGDWIQAIGTLLVFLIALLKMFGKKVHDMIPDNSWLDKPFWFLLETKPGGWLLNFLTVTGGGMGSVYLAGETVTWDIFKSIITLSLTASALWGLGKDIWEWIQSLKVKKLAEEAAKAAAVTTPPAPGA